jgi:hypothetical protein
MVDFKGNSFILKLYPPLQNTAKGVYSAKGGNILEYQTEAKALPKIRHSHTSSTLALQGGETLQHKQKKERTPPLESLDHNVTLEKEIVMNCNKQFIKHAG